MSLAGQFNVPNYQISGLPYVTQAVGTIASPGIIEFPYLTQWIMVNSTANFSVNIFFADYRAPNNPNAFQQATTTIDSMRLYFVRTKKLYITSSQPVFVMAGLTGIETGYEYIKPNALSLISSSFDLASTNYYSYGGL